MFHSKEKNRVPIKRSKTLDLNIIKLFCQISASRQSIIGVEEQRSLFRRLNTLGLCVFTETSDLTSKVYQIELILFMKKLFYLYQETVFKIYPPFGDVIWRSIMRISVYVISKSAHFFDEETIHKVWELVVSIRRRKIHKYLIVNKEPPASFTKRSNHNSHNTATSRVKLLEESQTLKVNITAQREAHIIQFSQVPASYLCHLEYVNQNRPLLSFQESQKAAPIEIYSDLVFFNFYTCFYQTNAKTENFGADENVLSNLLLNLKISLHNFKKFFLSRFKISDNFYHEDKISYYSGKSFLITRLEDVWYIHGNEI